MGKTPKIILCFPGLIDETAYQFGEPGKTSVIMSGTYDETLSDEVLSQILRTVKEAESEGLTIPYQDVLKKHTYTNIIATAYRGVIEPLNAIGYDFTLIFPSAAIRSNYISNVAKRFAGTCCECAYLGSLEKHWGELTCYMYDVSLYTHCTQHIILGCDENIITGFSRVAEADKAAVIEDAMKNYPYTPYYIDTSISMIDDTKTT